MFYYNNNRKNSHSGRIFYRGLDCLPPGITNHFRRTNYRCKRDQNYWYATKHSPHWRRKHLGEVTKESIIPTQRSSPFICGTFIIVLPLPRYYIKCLSSIVPRTIDHSRVVTVTNNNNDNSFVLFLSSCVFLYNWQTGTKWDVFVLPGNFESDHQDK